jgi:hypothetical protein
LDVGFVTDGNGRFEQPRPRQRLGVSLQLPIEEFAPARVEPIVGPDRPSEIPGVHQDIARQVRHQPEGIQLHSRTVAYSRYFNYAFEEVSRGGERLLNALVRQVPSRPRILTRAVRLQAQWPQQEHVMKPDDMLEHASGIPFIARRATLPLAFRGANSLAEPPARRQMLFTDTVTQSGQRVLS